MTVLGRPCADEHPDPALNPDCPGCRRAVHSRPHRIKWGLEVAPASGWREGARCLHMGRRVRLGDGSVKTRACG